jgi:hypothetical protein
MDTQNYSDRLKIRYLVIKTMRLITKNHCLNQFGKVWTSDFRGFLYILVGLVWTNGPELAAASWFPQGPGCLHLSLEGPNKKPLKVGKVMRSDMI